MFLKNNHEENLWKYETQRVEKILKIHFRLKLLSNKVFYVIICKERKSRKWLNVGHDIGLTLGTKIPQIQSVRMIKITLEIKW